MVTVTLLMGVGLIVKGLKGDVVGCIYSCFGVKTIPAQAEQVTRSVTK